MLLYSLSTLVPPLPHRLGLTMHFLHALSWRLFHSFGLGLLLRAQSKTKWYVRHYLKHYHYPSEEAGVIQKEGVVKRATEEAFRNWQVGYNISLVMTYGEFRIDKRASEADVKYHSLVWLGRLTIYLWIGLLAALC
jgi:phosphatidylethanolamine N-methyltransferase